MRLDPATLLLCHLLLISFTAAAMEFYGRRQRTFDGFGHFVAGTAAVAAGFFLFVARVFPALAEASILGAGTLFALGAALRYDGTRRFLAGVAAPRAVYAIPPAVLAWFALFRFAVDRFDLRALALGAVIFPFAFACASLHLSAARRSRAAIHLTMAASFLLTGLVMLWNGFSAVLSGTSPTMPPLAVPFLGILLLLDAVVALGVAILNAARLEEEQVRVHARLLDVLREAEAPAAEVRALEGLLPLCPSCRRVRDDQGSWTRLERYVSDRTGGIFSHGLCPDCAARRAASASPAG